MPPISRRAFLGRAALTGAAGLTPWEEGRAQPPQHHAERTGPRAQHPGSLDAAGASTRRGQALESYPDRAAMAAVASNSPPYAWVREVDAVYEWLPASGETANGWTVVTSSESGRWHLVSKELTLPIIGGGSDDWENFEDACAATAAVGKKLRLGAGQYQAKSRRFMANNAHVVCSPLTEIACDITSIDNRDAPFLGYHTITDADTLAANTSIGDQTVVIADDMTLAPGDFITLVDPVAIYRAAIYKVLAWDGGSKTATLDRPLRMQSGSSPTKTSFPSGSAVWKNVPAQSIKVELNGARLYGNCNRFIEFIGAWKCNVHGPGYLGNGNATTATERLISFDVPSYDCWGYDLYCDGGGKTELGLSFEGAQRSGFVRCEARRCTSAGAVYQDAIDCVIRDSACDENDAFGIVFTAGFGPPPEAGSVWGSHGCRFEGGSVSKNGTVGIQFERGSSQCKVIDTAVISNQDGIWDVLGNDNTVEGQTVVRLNTNSGIAVQPGPTRFHIAPSVTVHENGTYGIYVEDGSSKAHINGRVFLNPHNFVIRAACKATHLTLNSIGHANPLINVFSTGVLDASWLDVLQDDVVAPAIQTAGLLLVAGGRIQVAASGTGILGEGTAAIRLGSEVRISGHGSSGKGIDLTDTSTATLAAGVEIENRAIACVNAANDIETLHATELVQVSAR